MQAAEGPIATGLTASRVLLVDDEPNVLSALRRSLRGGGFEVSCVGSGAEGLELLQREPVDAIISDMRMPGMNGADFLRASLAWAPDAVRILLTGYADIGSAVRAINEGEVFRYVSKPWDDTLLLQGLSDGLARKALERERDALRAIAEQRAEQLRTLNEGLEEQVVQHTRDLVWALDEQRALTERARADFSNMMRLLSSLIEQRAGLSAGCARRVARHVRALGPSFGLQDEALQDATHAALLLDIGKLSLPDELVRRPLEMLGPREQERVLRHPLAGESSLMALSTLEGAGAVLAHVHENFDGSGVPGRCRGAAIPVAARLLRVAADYEHGTAGAIAAEPLTPEQAAQRLHRHRGTRYDPEVVDAFLRAVGEAPAQATPQRMLIASDGLRAGMVLAQDLQSPSGTLLLGQGSVLTPALVAHIRRLEALSGHFLWIAVQAKGEGCELATATP
jgi:response regulator RpfG family c-di-GMP phosphodiesterase